MADPIKPQPRTSTFLISINQSLTTILPFGMTAPPAIHKTTNERAHPLTLIKNKAINRLPALSGSQVAGGRWTTSIGQCKNFSAPDHEIGKMNGPIVKATPAPTANNTSISRFFKKLFSVPQCLRGGLVHTLHNHRDPLPAADASRSQPILLLPPPQFIKQSDHQPRPGSPQRMPQSNRPAIHIHLLTV
jgi:hypothetical protein